MKRFLCAAVLGLAGLAQAGTVVGFVDAFAIANWSQSLQGGIIDTSGAPASISLTSSDAGSQEPDKQLPSRQSISLQINQSGQLSFHWAFDTLDNGPAMDPFGYLLNGVFHQLSLDNSATLAHQGDATLLLQAGDVFGFAADSFDSAWGAATTVVSRFRFSDPDVNPVPEPATLLLSVLGLAGLCATGRKTHRRVA